jgi:hypothetical protein
MIACVGWSVVGGFNVLNGTLRKLSFYSVGLLLAEVLSYSSFVDRML